MEQAQTRPWVWYGGRPSVDFVNTRKHATGVDLLESPADLEAWLVAAGLVAGPAGVDEEVLAEARELRDAVDAGIEAVVTGRSFPSASARAISGWVAREALRPARLEVVDGVPVLRRDTASWDCHDALRRLALDAAELLGGSERASLRICPGPSCHGRFVDNSAGQRRRWCSMSTCGNRAKAARYRQSIDADVPRSRRGVGALEIT